MKLKKNGGFPDEAQKNLPPLKSLYANFVYWFIYSSKTVYVVGALIIVVLIAIVGFVIGYKVQKRRKRK